MKYHAKPRRAIATKCRQANITASLFYSGI